MGQYSGAIPPLTETSFLGCPELAHELTAECDRLTLIYFPTRQDQDKDKKNHDL